MKAVRGILSAVPADYPGTILVVIHLSPDSPGMLAPMLQAKSALPVEVATDGAAIRPGAAFVAPADRHLVVEDGRMRTPRGPRENRHRPAIDVTMRSAAVARGSRAVGVVLTGLLDDGSAGLCEIKHAGGVAIVQDPTEAEYPQMPRNAMRATEVDDVLRLAEIPGRLTALAAEEAPPSRRPGPHSVEETKVAEMSGLSTGRLGESGIFRPR